MNWKEQLLAIDMTPIKDLDELSEDSTAAKENDVGFVNSYNGAGIIARENGDLEGFADFGLGFRFSRKHQSLLVFAPNIHVFTQNIKTHDHTARAYLQDEYQDVYELLTNITTIKGE